MNPLLDPNARLVIAHRGNRIGAAENTVESLSQAVEMGADAIEFDVRMTRDGVPVLLHDAALDRTTNVSGLLRALTFDELRSVDAAGRSPARNGQPLPIPSLEEVLDRFRETPLVIEVKELGAAETTERLVRKFGAQDRVLIGSTDAAVMDRFYRSGLRTCASMRDASRLIPRALARMTPPKLMYDVLSLTPRFRGFPVPIQPMAACARKVGVATQVWTVNDPVQAKRWWACGVSGIVTDDPAAILRAREG